MVSVQMKIKDDINSPRLIYPVPLGGKPGWLPLERQNLTDAALHRGSRYGLFLLGFSADYWARI